MLLACWGSKPKAPRPSPGAAASRRLWKGRRREAQTREGRSRTPGGGAAPKGSAAEQGGRWAQLIDSLASWSVGPGDVQVVTGLPGCACPEAQREEEQRERREAQPGLGPAGGFPAGLSTHSAEEAPPSSRLHAQLVAQRWARLPALALPTSLPVPSRPANPRETRAAWA